MLGPLEIGLIALVILLLFGARKLPELGRGLGQGIRGFKEETRDLHRPAEDARPLNPELHASPELRPDSELRGEVVDVPSTELRAEDATAHHSERP